MASERARRASRVALHARALHAVRHDQVVAVTRGSVMDHERVGAARLVLQIAARARVEVVATASATCARLTMVLLLVMVETEGGRRAGSRGRPVSVDRVVTWRLLRENSVDLARLLVQWNRRALDAVRVVRRLERLVRVSCCVGGARRTVVGALDGELVFACAAHHEVLQLALVIWRRSVTVEVLLSARRRDDYTHLRLLFRSMALLAAVISASQSSWSHRRARCSRQ